MTRPPLNKFMGAPASQQEAQDRYESSLCTQMLTWLGRADCRQLLYSTAKRVGQDTITLATWNQAMVGFPAYLRASIAMRHRATLPQLFVGLATQPVIGYFRDLYEELDADRANRLVLVVNWPYMQGGVAIHTQQGLKRSDTHSYTYFKQKGFPPIIVEPVRQLIVNIVGDWDPPAGD